MKTNLIFAAFCLLVFLGAWHYHALPEFLGASLGAYLSTCKPVDRFFNRLEKAILFNRRA